MSRPLSHPALRLLLAAILLAGCSTQVVPPSDPVDPVTVHLTDYGRHASLLLPASDGGFDEYAFGDWAFFAEGKTAAPVAIRALLGSAQSTLGRRHIPPSEANLPGLLGTRRLMSFQAPRERAQALASNLDNRFQSTRHTPFYSTYSSLYHVPDDELYWALHNCNHVTAGWLRELGCRINGPAIFSNFVVAAPRPRGALDRRSDAPPAP